MGIRTGSTLLFHSEHSGAFGGQHSASSSGAREKKSAASFQRLPYNCCALTLKPVETPVCTSDGTLFELLSIIPWLKEHGTNPVTGKPMVPGDLISVNFHFNSDGGEHDPITYKPFNEHTSLVIIKSTGNVYSRETIERLNIKPGHWQDLMTDEPFVRSDIITLQDPLNVNRNDLSQFDHIKRDIKLSDNPTPKPAAASSSKSTVPSTSTFTSTSASASTSKLPEATVIKLKPGASSLPYNSSSISSNRTAAAFTSTSAPKQTTTENALLDEEDVMFKTIMKNGDKAFVRLVTNFGNLNLELFADKAPRTVYNFLQLAKEDKYKDTIFHRLIPGFMLQGGDPTGTGRGGTSCWGNSFEDEHQLRNAHKHEERGALSMANSGPNTNGSQFFLTFRATPHLDGKHTVFGRLVGGEDVLSKIERVPVDPATDRPLKKVILKDVAVFTDPFDVYQKKLIARLSKEEKDRLGAGEKAKKLADKDKDRTTWFGTNLSKPAPGALETAAAKSGGIGKYIAAIPTLDSLKRKDSSTSETGPNKKVKAKKDAFADW